MAAWAGEARNAPMFPASTFHPCPHPYPQATKAGDGWRFGARGCRPAPPSFLPGYRQLMAAEYVDRHQRAQLMALLSRMGPRSVSSRDAAVQFLEQKYGYYHCKDCKIRWESAYVWCVQGTSKVYFKEFCRVCEKSYNPYRVEDVTCQSCKGTRCACPVRPRHVYLRRPHQQHLCERCKDKCLSCDSTVSFKYMI